VTAGDRGEPPARIEAGPHEQRAVLRDPAGHSLVVYEPG
jgi:hypothetical protein